MTGAPYSWLLLAGIAVSLFTWTRLARRDERLVLIYLAALVCAFFGAKVVYLAGEGWMFWDSPQRWLIWATGKTILGALLGGYLGVELAKKLTRYAAPTGDTFAIVAPLGILFGRVGCLLQGCCLGAECAPRWWTLRDAHGIDRWPAVPAEIAFNVVALAAFAFLNRRNAEARRKGEQSPSEFRHSTSAPPRLGGSMLRGQLFHVYLIAYGAFRFAHEFARATPRIIAGLSGYHLAALAVIALGVGGFIRRHRENARVS